MPATPAERKRKERQSRREAGLVRVELWTTPKKAKLMQTIANREYQIGHGTLELAIMPPVKRVVILDVAGDSILAEYPNRTQAVFAMTAFANHPNPINTQMAIAYDFGDDLPLLVVETY